MLEDEKIILQRNEAFRNQHQDLISGIYVGKQFYQFETIDLFEGQMRMLLPKEFIDMPAEMQRKKYPSEFRPQVIKTSNMGDINFTFSHLEQKTGYGQLNDIISDYITVIRRLQPENLFFDKGLLEGKNTSCAWTEFKSYAINGDLYNLLFLSVIGGYLMMGMFNCPLEQWSDWKKYREQILKTIYDVEKGEHYESK